MSTANQIILKMFEMKLATCEARVLPESTDSLKTSYLSRENTYRLVIVDFEVEEVRYGLIRDSMKAVASPPFTKKSVRASLGE